MKSRRVRALYNVVLVQHLVLILRACPRPVTMCRCACHDPEEEKPVVANITVSDVSWDSFLLSWSADSGGFQAFLITVMDAETGSAWQNHTVSGDAESLAISGLLPTTWYRVSLHGLHRGTLSEPLSADTITGTTSVTDRGSAFSSIGFLLYSLASHFPPGTEIPCGFS